MSQSSQVTRPPQRPRCRACGGRLIRWGKSVVCTGCPLPVRVVGPVPPPVTAGAA